MSNSICAALSNLQELNLITPPQRDCALAHPDLPQFSADATLPDLLEWLLGTGIVPEDALMATIENLPIRCSGDDLEQRRELINQTLRSINRKPIELLRQEDLIDDNLYQFLMEELPTNRILGSPAATLKGLLDHSLISPEEWKARCALTRADNTKAAAIIVETEALRKQAYSHVIKGAPLLTRWVIFGGVPLAIACSVIYVLIGSSVPGCDSNSTRKTINNAFLLAAINGSKADASAQIMSQAKEVGYNSEQKIRGCTGTLITVDGKKPFAFTIATAPANGKSGFVVASANPELVTMRFSNLNDRGDFKYMADPIGRDNLQQALRKKLTLPGAAERMDVARSAPLVGEVEPMGACSPNAARAGTEASYVCPLLVEWNNPVFAAIGVNAQLMLRGNFSFERGSAGQRWRVTKRFPDELNRALADSLIKARQKAVEAAVEPAPLPQI